MFQMGLIWCNKQRVHFIYSFKYWTTYFALRLISVFLNMVPILKPKCYQVKVNNIKLITRLANWYFEEWGIPKERTLSRLVNHPNDDVLIQLVLKEGNRIIATGGLYNNTCLTLIFPKYKALSPLDCTALYW